MEEFRLTPNMEIFFDKLIKIKTDLFQLAEQDEKIKPVYEELHNLIKEKN